MIVRVRAEGRQTRVVAKVWILTDQSLQFPRFYVTAPSPCPYLPDREERKVFTELKGDDADALNEALSRVGFRRSQSVAYRPACDGCNACISMRVLAQEFKPNRSMRRIERDNADLVVTRTDPWASDEQFLLLKKYLTLRHSGGGMSDMDIYEYTEMIENTPVNTMLIEYREPGEPGSTRPGPLVAAALTDVMSDGLSMVYSFFDPESTRRSLGTQMILEHVQRAAQMGLQHVYLGYWIADSPKMAYKAQFRPFERLGPEGWFRCGPDGKPIADE